MPLSLLFPSLSWDTSSYLLQPPGTLVTRPSDHDGIMQLVFLGFLPVDSRRSQDILPAIILQSHVSQYTIINLLIHP